MKIITDFEKVELAKAYVALSNAHMLKFVVPMFTAEASYHSPHVGTFNGRSAIEEMMTGFFSRFPDVRWNARNYRSTSDGSVRFDFVMIATETETGKKIQRIGGEEIDFTEEGFIHRVEVHKH